MHFCLFRRRVSHPFVLCICGRALRLNLQQVEIDAVVLYLLAGVCCAAFFPPMACKMKQMFCETAQVHDSYEED